MPRMAWITFPHVLPKLHAKLLGGLVDFIPVGSGCKGFILPFLFNRGRLQIIERAGGAHQRYRGDQPGDLVASRQGFFHAAQAGHAAVVCVA